MRKKVVTGICILLAIVHLIPIPMRLKAGGTVVYNAILYQVEDLYIVENDLEDPSALRVGDEIVVSAKNLYDGKIIK